jgi:hypothetical protein
LRIFSKSPVFNAYIARAEREYRALSSTPNGYQDFLAQIEKIWATQPHWTAADLASILVPTWIVDADHDEAIKRENTEFVRKHSRRRTADPARSEPLLVPAKPRAVQQRRAALP